MDCQVFKEDGHSPGASSSTVVTLSLSGGGVVAVIDCESWWLEPLEISSSGGSSRRKRIPPAKYCVPLQARRNPTCSVELISPFENAVVHCRSGDLRH